MKKELMSGALYEPANKKTEIKQLNKKSLFIVIAAVLVGYVTYVSFEIYSYGNVDEKIKADAAIVLGAGVRGNRPSAVFAERIKHAIWLYQNGYVGKLIFTGGKGVGNTYSDAFIAREYALKYSVPVRDIFIEELSTTTRGNIAHAAAIALDNNLSTFLIVSDPLHMKRAMLAAKDSGLTAWSSPTPSTRYRTPRARAYFLAREVCFYIGYIFYRLLPV